MLQPNKLIHLLILERHGNPLSLVLSPKVSFRHQRQKTYSARGFKWEISLAVWNRKSFESYKNLLTLPLVNPRHHIGKLKGFAYLLFEALSQLEVSYEIILLGVWNLQSLESYMNLITLPPRHQIGKLKGFVSSG